MTRVEMQFNFTVEFLAISYVNNNMTDDCEHRSTQARILAYAVPLRRVTSRHHVGDYLCATARKGEAAEEAVPESSVHVSSD